MEIIVPEYLIFLVKCACVLFIFLLKWIHRFSKRRNETPESAMSTAERLAIAAAAAAAGEVSPPVTAEQARQQLGWGLIVATELAR